jgi:hypothetical protein
MKTFPYMLIMRNSRGGVIWQAYEVRNETEVKLLTKTATHNGFLVQEEEVGYADETTPGWRDTQEWKDYLAGKLSPRALGQERVREVLKDIRRDGPYWLTGYHDWLVSCFSLRDLDDLHGFTPIACWSELDGNKCKQWMVCVKDDKFYVDQLHGMDASRGYGLKPQLAESLTLPPHVFDWVFKDVIPKYLENHDNTKASKTEAPVA